MANEVRVSILGNLFLGLPIVLALGLLPTAGEARAEIYQCDGKWTNKPCAGAIEKTISESMGGAIDAGGELPPEAPAVPENSVVDALEPLAPRYALCRKLRKISKEFSQKHNISLTKDELRAFDERCTKRETPFAQCQAEHDAFVQRLNAQVQALAQKKK